MIHGGSHRGLIFRHSLFLRFHKELFENGFAFARDPMSASTPDISLRGICSLLYNKVYTMPKMVDIFLMMLVYPKGVKSDVTGSTRKIYEVVTGGVDFCIRFQHVFKVVRRSKTMTTWFSTLAYFFPIPKRGHARQKTEPSHLGVSVVLIVARIDPQKTIILYLVVVRECFSRRVWTR